MIKHGTLLDIIAIVFTALATAAVALRFWVRIRILKRFQIEDWLIALTLVLIFFENAKHRRSLSN
jgi:hypothetical protein